MAVDDEDEKCGCSVKTHPGYTESVIEAMLDIALSYGYEAAQAFKKDVSEAEDAIARNPMSGRSAKEVGRSRSGYVREKLCYRSKSSGKYQGSIGYDFRHDGVVRLIGFNFNTKQDINY